MFIVLPLLFFKDYRAMAIFPFIVLRYSEDRNNKVLVNHEKIHFRQQLELLFFPFFLWYFLEYVVRLIQKGDTRKAYFSISFEKECYAHEQDLEYLKKRPFWAFLKFYGK